MDEKARGFNVVDMPPMMMITVWSITSIIFTKEELKFSERTFVTDEASVKAYITEEFGLTMRSNEEAEADQTAHAPKVTKT